MRYINAIRFWLLFAVNLLLVNPVFAEDVNLKKGASSGNDAALANIFSVRSDYFLRFPHAKRAEAVRGREPDTTKEMKDSIYELPSWGYQLTVPAGPLVAQQTISPPIKPDPYFLTRPLYRPLYAYCGSPGAFIPPPPTMQPGMLGTFVPNYSKIAKGEGGNVVLAPPMAPTCYVQPLLVFNDATLQAQEGDQSIFEYELTTFGVGPISDTQFQMIDREDNQRFLELMFDPERWLWAARAAGIMQQQQMSTNMANTADWESVTAQDTIAENLINVANEQASSPVRGSPAHKTKQQVIYMVQQMYKQVFLPMAILLLLPGAIMTQMKGMVQFGVLNTPDEDAQSPFTGIVRSVIAIFLIPATQLIISYMIDVGNSMSLEVKKWVDQDLILAYAHEQQFGSQRDMTLNVLAREPEPPQAESQTDPTTKLLGGTSPGGLDAQIGKAYSSFERTSVEEKTYQLSKQMQLVYNVFNVGASCGLVVLGSFQFVMMCYLFLLGPVAASFYAWPNMRGKGVSLFNKVFGNWIEAVIVLSLWRFWWNVVLACETTYIQWAREQSWFVPNSDWEMMVFTSFQVLLLAVPFAPFNFSAAPHIDKIQKDMQKEVDSGGAQGGSGSGGSSSAGGHGGGARGGGGGGGDSGGGSSGGGESYSVSAEVTSSGGSGGGSGGGSDRSSMSDEGGGSSAEAGGSGVMRQHPPPPPSDDGGGRHA